MLVLLEILAIAIAALLVARLVPQPWRGHTLNLLKAWVTLRAFWILLAHPVTLQDGSRVVAGRLVLDTLAKIDAGTFWAYCGLAASVKFVGILASMYRWTLLLRGQGVELPFRHIFGSFLIGRFIGTFLPSTAGLDGYKLYDAARFSGRSVEAAAATLLEKVLGFSGIFLSFLVALPFGIVIFGEYRSTVAALAVPFCVSIIAGLLLVLFHPGLVTFVLEKMPIPGKARLSGLVTRISKSAAAYRHKRGLVVTALGLSFVVHFTTSAMYYFTALAIGADRAEFWPVAFGSSIQILATVLSPFTIAGEGIREAAQYALLGHQIGPGNAIVSAALGFWAAEALTLVGGLFWWLRGPNYRPAYCLADGRQVDFEDAAREAARFVDPLPGAGGPALAALPPLASRARSSGAAGLAAGVFAGLLVGAVETAVVAAGGFGAEAQALWWGPFVYGLCFGALGLGAGVACSVFPMDRDEIRGWAPSLAILSTLVPIGLAIAVFRVRRDVFAEQLPPIPVLAAMLGAAALVAGLLFFAGPRLFRGPLRFASRPGIAAAVLLLASVCGAVAARTLATAPVRAEARGIPEALASAPNLILVMIDTLRADHLSCYGGRIQTPSICSLAADGAIFDGFSHASWTKPATATLLTGLLPKSHGAMSKTAALPESLTLLPELLRERGYETGGVVSNINLAESFGFRQGYDEYHYLAPDYLLGAEESSSKLVLYNILRAVWFKFSKGYRVGEFYQDSTVVNEVALDFLERERESRFFLFLHYMDPHDPYFAHPYDGHAIARVANQHPDPSLTAEMMRLYAGEVAYVDASVGVLLAQLKQLGLYENTVIALVADHGEEFQEHGGFWHGLTLYDEQIRVPLLIKWARGDGSASGDQRGWPARLIDVVPTLLARAGVAAPPELPGRDLGRQPPSARSEHERLVFAEEDHEGNVLRALRSRDWKWIEANPGNPRGLPPEQLFEILADPGERSDLHDAQPQRAAELREHAAAQELLAGQLAPAAGSSAEISESQRQALEALGYLEGGDAPTP